MSNYLIYLRKSRADSESETVEEVLARHEKQLQEFAIKKLGYKIPNEDIYREVVSGETIDDRPEINLLLRRIESHDIYGVITIEPQRLTRGDMLDCGTIVHAFRYSNTLIMTPNKVYDLSDKFDRKFFEMELSRGNDYLEYTKEILQRGKLASVKEGNYISNRPPFGYDKTVIDKCNTLVPNDDAAIVQLMFELYVNKDMGCTKIARYLDKMGVKPKQSQYWNPTGIRDILQNPVYIGKVRWNFRKCIKVYRNGKIVKTNPRSFDCMIIDGKHPAIIDEKLFQKAQDLLGTKTREPLNRQMRNPLAGLLKCKNCGRAMSYRTYKKNGVEKCRPRYLCDNQVHCGSKSSDAESIIHAVIRSLEKIIDDFEVKISHHSDDNAKIHESIIQSLKKELDKLEVRQNELYDYLENKLYTKEVFLMRNAKLAKQKEELERKLNFAQKNKPKEINYQEKITTFKKIIEYLQDEKIPAKYKNELLRDVIERIEYTAIKQEDNKSHKIKLDIFLKQ